MTASLSSPAILKIVAQNLTSDLDLTREELSELIDLAILVKRSPRDYSGALAGRYLSLLFEKPSLRTLLTFELAIKQLGGGCGHLHRTGRRPRADQGHCEKSGSLDACNCGANILPGDHRNPRPVVLGPGY